MPAFETMDLLQRAVVWPRAYNADGSPRSDRLGQPVVNAPIPLTPPRNGVNYVENLSESLDPKGANIVVEATMVTAQDIPIDSIVWLGVFADLPTDLTMPLLGTGAGGSDLPWPSKLMIVKTASKGSDLKNRFISRSYGLQRYKDALPGIV